MAGYKKKLLPNEENMVCNVENLPSLDNSDHAILSLDCYCFSGSILDIFLKRDYISCAESLTKVSGPGHRGKLCRNKCRCIEEMIYTGEQCSKCPQYNSPVHGSS